MQSQFPSPRLLCLVLLSYAATALAGDCPVCGRQWGLTWVTFGLMAVGVVIMGVVR